MADDYRKTRGPLDDEQVAKLCQHLAGNQQLLGELDQHGLPVTAAGLAAVKGVKSFQLDIIKPCVDHLAARTTAGVSSSGLEQVVAGAILAATHTDILFDSAIVDWLLVKEGKDTALIAAGANLFSDRTASLLLRANRAYAVIRGRASKSEMAGLSRMINEDCDAGYANFISSEGRAKDGKHRIGAKVVKLWMLGSGLTASAYVAMRPIVPVSITYEFIPDAERMAEQRLASAQDSGWMKPPDADLKSMLSGLFGWKGRVHVAFGERLRGGYASPAAVADAIDAANHRNARLFPTHQLGLVAVRQGYAAARNFVSQFKPEERSAVQLWDGLRYISERKQMAILEQYGNVAKDHYEALAH